MSLLLLVLKDNLSLVFLQFTYSDLPSYDIYTGSEKDVFCSMFRCVVLYSFLSFKFMFIENLEVK